MSVYCLLKTKFVAQCDKFQMPFFVSIMRSNHLFEKKNNYFSGKLRYGT